MGTGVGLKCARWQLPAEILQGRLFFRVWQLSAHFPEIRTFTIFSGITATQMSQDRALSILVREVSPEWSHPKSERGLACWLVQTPAPRLAGEQLWGTARAGCLLPAHTRRPGMAKGSAAGSFPGAFSRLMHAFLQNVLPAYFPVMGVGLPVREPASSGTRSCGECRHHPHVRDGAA